MKKGFLLKHEKTTRNFHWVNLVVFLLLLISGLSIFNKNLSWLAAIFGGLQNAALAHMYLGFAYFIAPLLYIVTNFDLFKKFITRISSFDADDIAWFKVAGGYLEPIIKVKGHVPPQGKYNAGQKVLAIIVIIFSCFIAASGLIMIFFEGFPPVLVRLSYLCHSFSGIMLGCCVIVHFYLAAINPSSRNELKTMLGDGYNEEDYAKAHNPKWHREMVSKTK